MPILQTPLELDRDRTDPWSFWLGLVAIITGLVLRLSWAWMIPYNDAPDEFCHWPMVAYLAEHLRPPTMSDVPVTIPVSYPALCPVGYIIPAVAAAIYGPNRPEAYIAARVAQALLSIIFLTLVYLASRELDLGCKARSQRGAMLVTWLAALHPQLVFTFAYVNNDASMLTASMGLWWCAIAMIQRGPSASRVALASALFALAVLCKTNAIGLGLIAIPLAIFVTIQSTSRQQVAVLGATSLMVTAAVVAPWSIWSWIHHRSLLGFELHARWWQNYIKEKQIHQGFLKLDDIDTFLVETWESSWACFGYASVRISPAGYFLATFLLAISLGAWLARKKEIPSLYPINLVLLSGTVGVWSAHIYHSMNVGLTSQGRYVLPAVWPVLVLISSAARSIGKTRAQATTYSILLVVALGWMQYLSWHAENRSNRIRQPDRRVRARLISYAGNIPGQAEQPPISFAAVGPIEQEARGDRVILHSNAGSAIRWPVPLDASSVGGLSLDQHWLGGTLPLGRLRVLSANGAEVPLGEIKYADPILGRVRYRFDLRTITEKLGHQLIWIEYRPSEESAQIVIDRWTLLDPSLQPWP
jgi:hypothetical protein